MFEINSFDWVAFATIIMMIWVPRIFKYEADKDWQFWAIWMMFLFSLVESK